MVKNSSSQGDKAQSKNPTPAERHGMITIRKALIEDMYSSDSEDDESSHKIGKQVCSCQTLLTMKSPTNSKMLGIKNS